MGNTKKVRTTGRFGARYGVGIRKRLLKVEDKQNQKHECPTCGFKKIKRKAAGLFVCTKCGAEFAGGAYLPNTMTGSTVKKIISQKAFNTTTELLENEEEKETKVSEEKGDK